MEELIWGVWGTPWQGVPPDPPGPSPLPQQRPWPGPARWLGVGCGGSRRYPCCCQCLGLTEARSVPVCVGCASGVRAAIYGIQAAISLSWPLLAHGAGPPPENRSPHSSRLCRHSMVTELELHKGRPLCNVATPLGTTSGRRSRMPFRERRVILAGQERIIGDLLKLLCG